MSARVQITRRLEFDAGHRIPDHASQCKHLHGHRYAIEVTVEGPVQSQAGVSDNGMVIDFGVIKDLVRETVVDPWDHAFLAWREDAVVLEMLSKIAQHKTVVLDRVPTAENLAIEAFERIDRALRLLDRSGLSLVRVRLFETPNCWSDAVARSAP